MTTLVKAWKSARQRLESAGVETPVIDARILLLAASGETRTALISDPHKPLSEAAEARLEHYLTRRIAREPVAHIVGRKGFWTIELKCDERALVPRPETEVIVDIVLKNAPKDAPIRILDLGVGTGAILLALLAERSNWRGVGTDISEAALDLAAENAAAIGVQERVILRQQSWTEGLEGRFDVVVSNPPYIRRADIETLMPEVRRFDPHLALDGGEDGLEPYRIIIPALAALLKPDGLFCLEFGLGQGEAVLRLAQQEQGLTSLALVKDLTDRERVLAGRSSGVSERQAH